MPQHRAEGRWVNFRLDIDGLTDRETSPVATLAREPVPDGERYRHELSGRERGARGRAKGPLEDDRPFTLVVARDAGEIPRVVRRDRRASLAGELKGIGSGHIEEPEIHRVLRVAKNEVRLAGARQRRRRNLDRNGVREFGWLTGGRRRFSKGVLRGTCWRLRLPGGGWPNFRVAKGVRRRRAGARSTACARRSARSLLLLFQWHGKRRPALSCFLRARVVPSNEEGDRLGVVDRLNGHGGGGGGGIASGLGGLAHEREARGGRGVGACCPLLQLDRMPGGRWGRQGGICRRRGVPARDSARG